MEVAFPSPPLTPGRLFCWQDNLDRWWYALAIAVEHHMVWRLYTVTYVFRERIKSVNLYLADRDIRWRALLDE